MVINSFIKQVQLQETMCALTPILIHLFSYILNFIIILDPPAFTARADNRIGGIPNGTRYGDIRVIYDSYKL